MSCPPGYTLRYQSSGLPGYPGDELPFVKYRDYGVNIGGMNISDERIVTAEDISLFNPRIFLVVIPYHELDGLAHCMNVHEDSGRMCYGVPSGV